MSRYKCLECEELFEHEFMCVIHHVNCKHEKFEIDGTDIKLNIKS